MSPSATRLVLLGVASGLLVAGVACEEPDVPVGPPRCEPEHEHEIDRRLKLAFKALATGDADRARVLFMAVLAEEPQHPEAQLGLRLLSGKRPIEPAPDAPETEGRAAPSVEIANQLVALRGDDAPTIDGTRWRFEELRALAPMRKQRDGQGVLFDYYRERYLNGAPAAVGDLEELVDRVDLIVLHDTHTRSAREAIVVLEGSGSSTHFIIDWDGSIFQVLDLAWEANHSQRAGIDARSISIDLVNPVELGDEPGLPQSAEDRGQHRPLSDFVVVQGREVQQWGYTAEQVAGLVALVRSLGELLPRIPMRVPGSAGAVPRERVGSAETLAGVIGHLHVSGLAMDPGAGFPWEAFGRAIRDEDVP